MLPGTELEIIAVDDRLEIEVPRTCATLVDGPDGRSLIHAPAGGRLNTEAVRAWRLRLQDPRDRGDDR